ncbi:unnamed protein product [Cochlearia groenlandica]
MSHASSSRRSSPPSLVCDKCTVCDKAFSSYQALGGHKAVLHGNKSGYAKSEAFGNAETDTHWKRIYM